MAAIESSPEPSLPSVENSTPGLPYPVVGIGASAGGLLAVQKLLEHLPADTGMAFVIVLHLSPKHESNADKILQRSTRMPVAQVLETTPIEPNHVYVISPRHTLAMEDGHLAVSASNRPRGPLVAIDLFFRTLADVHRDRSIGVVLSGTGSDGTVGIARLKEQGGVTLAQLPADAEYEDMPRNAMASGHVDFVLPVSDIPQKLIDIWSNARAIELPDADVLQPPVAARSDERPDSEQALREIIALLATRTGHDFHHYKRATVLRRIERRLQVRLLTDLPAYRDYLRANPDETRALLDDMQISVTNFFRDREAYESLERIVIPRLFAERGGSQQSRVWVPGCATGEEAYSLAMLMQDEAAGLAVPSHFQIFATDIDERAVATARNGIYPPSIVTDLPPQRLRQYFNRETSRYRVKKSLREHILFATHNALRDPPFSKLDLISCRNVLIYLNRDMQEKLLEVFRFALRSGGYLFLGNSESADAAADLFEIVDKKNRIFRARPTTRRKNPALPLRVATGFHAPHAATTTPHRQTASGMHQRILEQYAPPSAIIDGDSNIVHMSENAGRFMQVPAGVPSHNLLALIRPELRLELRSAIFQATHTRSSVQARRVRLELEGCLVYVNMIVRPFDDPDAGASYALVLFEEVEDTMSVDAPRPAETNEHEVLLQLERELLRTKEQLQTTMELSDSSTEELKASNEELQAINEELRSTTEELETSTEELQSVNEELITVNAELKNKVDETERSNDDLQNFIASTDIATIFVDADLNIMRYTPRVELLFSMIPTDVGRSLLDITHRLDYPMLGEDAAAAMRTRNAVEREVQSVEGRWFIARIRPYQTAKRETEGAVLTFIDITSLRIAEERLVRDDEELKSALAHSKDFAAITTDVDGLITGWNEGAERMFRLSAADAVGSKIHVIFLPEDVAAGVPETEMAKAKAAGRAEDDRWHCRPDGSRIFCSGVMTPLDVGSKPGFIKIVRDMTQQQHSIQQSARKLAQARARRADAEAAIALKDEFLAVMSHELKHPLNLINVNAEIIGRAPDLGIDRSPVASRALRKIGRAVRTQTKIIDDLLDLSRMRTGKLTLERTAVNLASLVESAVETAAADSSAAEIEIAFEASDASVVVHADTGRLNQIVWNLLSNAVKFTPAGGRILARVSVEGSYGRLDVTDTGQGIDPAFLPKIFEMFGQARARASSTQSGLGIGLALVKQLAELHGGLIQASSAGPGFGARFSVSIPLYSAELGVDPSSAGASDATRCPGIRVLIVDDDPATVEALRTLLELEGAQVTPATSVAEALQLLQSNPPNVVVTDIGMPEQDGYALIRQIRSDPLHSNLPVIALTGFGREHDVRRTQEAGFYGHIGKPVVFEHLLQKMCEAVSARE